MFVSMYSYTGDAFVRSALLGRAATVHVQAGEGYGSLASCLARGLGVEFMAIKFQVSYNFFFQRCGSAVVLNLLGI